MLVRCPTCGTEVEVAGLAPGSTAACPICTKLFQVPLVETTLPTAWPLASPMSPPLAAMPPVDPHAATASMPPTDLASEMPPMPPPIEAIAPPAWPPEPLPEAAPVLPPPFGPAATSDAVDQVPWPPPPPAGATEAFVDSPTMWMPPPAVSPPMFLSPQQAAYPTPIAPQPPAEPPPWEFASASRTPSRAKQGRKRSTGVWLMYAVVFAVMLSGAALGTYHFAKQSAETQAAQLAPAPQPPLAPQPPRVRESPIGPELPTDASKSWKRVFRVSGTGPRTTDQFRVNSPRWRIVWWARTLPEQTADNFAIMIDNPAGTQVATPVSIVGTGEDTAYVQLKPGRYKLEILAFNSSWDITVEESQ